VPGWPGVDAEAGFGQPPAPHQLGFAALQLDVILTIKAVKNKARGGMVALWKFGEQAESLLLAVQIRRGITYIGLKEPGTHTEIGWFAVIGGQYRR